MIYTNEMIKEKNKQKLKIQKVLKCLSIPVIVFILIISLYISYQKITVLTHNMINCMKKYNVTVIMIIIFIYNVFSLE